MKNLADLLAVFDSKESTARDNVLSGFMKASDIIELATVSRQLHQIKDIFGSLSFGDIATIIGEAETRADDIDDYIESFLVPSK